MRLRHTIGFAVFCLFAGSRWLVDDACPQTLPHMLAQSMHYTIAGLMALIMAKSFRTDAQWDKPFLLRIVLAGLVLLAVPSLLGLVASSVRAETSVVLYAMVPLCVIAMAMTRDDSQLASMMPALAGLTGMLLLLPWRLPSTATGTIAFSLVIVGALLTAVGSVWMHALLRGKPPLRSVAVVALGNAVVLGLAGAMHGERLAPLSRGDYAALAIDLLQLFLLLWLISEVAPERFASRFFLVPLVTLIEGAVLFRAQLDGRTAVGVLLLWCGTWLLLRGKRETTLSLGLR